MLKRLPALIAVGLFANTSLAADSDSDNEFNYAIGALAFTYSSPYIGGEQQTQLFPYLEFNYGPIFFEGGSLGSHLYGGDNWGIAAAVSLDFMGDTERGDSRQLSDMEELDHVINGSLIVFYETDWGEFDLSLTTDISNNHDGQTAALSYSYPIKAGNWYFSPSVSAQWFSEEVANYYYGVGARDVKANRPLYNADSGINYSISLMADYAITEQHHLIFDISTTIYSDEIKNSPIVDESSSTSFGAGYIFRF